jgi:hypothetical protein
MSFLRHYLPASILVLALWMLLTGSSGCPDVADPQEPDGNVLLFIPSGTYSGCSVYAGGTPGDPWAVSDMVVRIYTVDGNNNPVQWGSTQIQSQMNMDLVGNYTIKVPKKGQYRLMVSFKTACDACCGYTRSTPPPGCTSPEVYGTPLFEYDANQSATYYGERIVIHPRVAVCDCNCD